MTRDEPSIPLFCARCTRALHPGDGDFYAIRIEAFADPSPPTIPDKVVPPDIETEIRRLIEQAAGMTEQELMDQVYRRTVLFLCRSCYLPWIENPVG